MAHIENTGKDIKGKATFGGYRFAGVKQTPCIDVICEDENGNTAKGTLWCSEKAIPYTVKKLKAMGVDGDGDSDVLANAEDQLDGSPCMFDIVKSDDGYFNVDNMRGPDGEGIDGGGDTADRKAFIAEVFGAAAAAKVGAAKPDNATDEPPF